MIESSNASKSIKSKCNIFAKKFWCWLLIKIMEWNKRFLIFLSCKCFYSNSSSFLSSEFLCKFSKHSWYVLVGFLLTPNFAERLSRYTAFSFVTIFYSLFSSLLFWVITEFISFNKSLWIRIVSASSLFSKRDLFSWHS